MKIIQWSRLVREGKAPLLDITSALFVNNNLRYYLDVEARICNAIVQTKTGHEIRTVDCAKVSGVTSR